MNSGFILKLILLAAIFLLLPALPAIAADINVDATCTLTQAINEANGLTSNVGSCEAGTDGSGTAGADTIILPPGHTYTVSERSISSHIAIRAFGSLISGNNSNRVFSVTGAGKLTLTSAGVEKGRSNANGGAIFVDTNGSLSLIDSSVRNSEAARGGGIYSDGGTVSINRSALHNNTAGSSGNGGAIYMDGGSVTITNSTLFSNTGGRRGGGIYQSGGVGEGAVSSLTLIHVTVTKNTSSHSTGSAGVHAFRGSQSLRNSIIWGNTRNGAAANCSLNTVTALTNNVIGGGSSANCTASQITSNPRLSPGPTGFVRYFTLGPDSSARDAAGDCTSLTTVDQTGIRTRPIGSACDIGAYEADEVPPAPMASFTAAVDSGNSLTYDFDASGSTGQIDSYAWNFGDGNTGSGQSASHTYATGGDYTVTLTVSNSGGSDSATRALTVLAPPVANFSAAVDTGNSLRYNFDASGSTGQIDSYAWNFGDGNTGSGQSASHTYATGGDYTVTLTVTNSAGSGSTSQNIAVQTPLTPASASFVFEVSGLRVVFTSTSTGSNLAYSWDVDGDGSEDYSVANPEHTYSTNSAYTVTLTVSNAKPSSDSASREVIVSALVVPRPDPGPTVPGSSPAAPKSAPEPTPTVSTCLTLPGIQVSGISESTQCQRVDAVGIANPNIREGDFVDAVDVWSWVLPNMQICFEAAGGGFTFIDTTTIPRTVHDLEAYSLDGMTCATIDGPGIVVLLPGDPPPARATQLSSGTLSGCMVTATAKLNFRASPGGAAIGMVDEGWTLTALSRTDGWFEVDRFGQKGWISADYVETDGTCG